MRTFKDCADCGARLDRVDWANGGLAWHEYDAILEPHAQRHHDRERCLTAQLGAARAQLNAARAQLAAVRVRLEQIVGYQLGGPCVQRGEEGTVLDVAERVSLGVTRLNEKCNSRGEQRDQLRALIAECVVALLAVVPYVDEALRARFTEDVAALVARAQR